MIYCGAMNLAISEPKTSIIVHKETLVYNENGNPS